MSAGGSPQWGRVDPHAAAVALGATIPLAILFTACVLFMGWFSSPGDRKEVIVGNAATVWQSRPAASGRFQTQPEATVSASPL